VRRLLTASFISLLIYALVFGCIIDRPLSLGFLQQQMDAKLARAATIHRPKIVILAGSNGPYSHRCEVIEPILGMPCVNGGVAVGLGLDYIFTRWKPELHAGDLVYLPMEEEQYVRTRSATDTGPDAAIMFRHDWHTLFSLDPARWLAALFSADLRAAVMGPMEAGLLALHFHDPRIETTGATNAWGDHVGHTAELAHANQAALAVMTPHHVSAEQVCAGYGAMLIADFTRWATAHAIRVIGGLPTEFADQPMPDATLRAISAIYLSNGGMFLELSSLSRYPREAFFDSPEHLNETWQIRHSQLLAARLQWLRAPIAAAHPAGPAVLPAAHNTPTN
jgi:hypothetical protein